MPRLSERVRLLLDSYIFPNALRINTRMGGLLFRALYFAPDVLVQLRKVRKKLVPLYQHFTLTAVFGLEGPLKASELKSQNFRMNSQGFQLFCNASRLLDSDVITMEGVKEVCPLSH